MGQLNSLLVAVMLGTSLCLAGSGEMAEFIEWSDVCFPHEMHFDDLEIECESCHHETHAASLATPHEEYFSDFWIDCAVCHKPASAPAASTACSSCHHDSPVDVADETLSSKVVIHQSCWSCHEVGRGVEASRACGSCHDGEHRHPSGDDS